MNKDAAIRAFIKKRELFRLLTFISLGGLVLYGIIIPDFFPVITMGEYEKAYRISVMLWVATTFFLGNMYPADCLSAPFAIFRYLQ